MMLELMKTLKNPIYEVEVMPIYLVAVLWAHRFRVSQVVWYTDNEAARSAYIKAYGVTRIADAFVGVF